MALASAAHPAGAQPSVAQAPPVAPPEVVSMTPTSSPLLIPAADDRLPRTVNLPAAVTVTSRLTATNNGGLDAPGHERRDYILSLRPEIAFASQGAKVRFDFRGAAAFLAYANGTQSNGVLPDIGSTLKTSIVDNWLYFDAGFQARNSAANLFGVRTDDLTGVNRRTETGYSLAPHVEHHFGPSLDVLARWEHGMVTNAAGNGTRLTSDSAVLRLERKPVPFGYLAEVSHLVNRTNGGPAFPSSHYTLDTARLQGNVEAAEQWRFGAILGSDRSKYLITHTDPLYGGEIAWSPSARTHLTAELVNRYFGRAANVRFEHRTPFMAVSLVYLQQPVDSTVALGNTGPSGNLRGFLDAILTTRYPDPAVRSGQVDSVLNNSGLNSHAAGAVDIVSDYPQLQTVARATAAYLGSRNTATVSVYSQSNRQLIRKDDALSAVIPATSDFRQSGLSGQLNHRLTPDMSVTGLVKWSRVVGLGTQQGQTSDERNIRLSLTKNVSLKSAVSAGLERTRFTTTATEAHSYSATLGFIGLVHRF